MAGRFGAEKHAISGLLAKSNEFRSILSSPTFSERPSKIFRNPIALGIRRAIEITRQRGKDVPEFIFRLNDDSRLLDPIDLTIGQARRTGSDRLEHQGLPINLDDFGHVNDLRVSDLTMFRDVLSFAANSHLVYTADTHERNIRQHEEPPLDIRQEVQNLPISFIQAFAEYEGAINPRLNPNWNLPYSITLIQRGDTPTNREFHIFIDGLKHYKFRALISYSQESLGSWSFAIRRVDRDGNFLEPPEIRHIVEPSFTKDVMANSWNALEGKGALIGFDDTNAEGVEIGASPKVKVDAPDFVDRLLELWLHSDPKPFKTALRESYVGPNVVRKPVRMDYFTFGHEIPQGQSGFQRTRRAA